MVRKTQFKSRHWTDEEVTKLIILYKECEFLWDVKHKWYCKHISKKNDAFNKIATNFENCDAREVHRKLHNLRCQLCNEMNKMKRLDGYQSHWKFLPALDFVVPYIREAKFPNLENSDKIREQTDEGRGSKRKEPEQSDEEAEVNKMESSETEQTQVAREIKSRTQTQDDDPVENGDQEEASALKISSDIDLFGEYVAMELKNLKSDYYRSQLKSAIRKAIVQYTDLDESSYWNEQSPSNSSITSHEVDTSTVLYFEEQLSSDEQKKTS